MNALIRLLACGVVLASAAGAQPSWDFNFGSGAHGAIKVEPGTLYSPETGYGFEPVQAALDHGALFEFSAAVPEGDYRVTVVLRGKATVKAESRRLMVEHSKGRSVSFVVNVRNASLPPPPLNAPGASQVRLYPRETQTYTWDDKLTLSFSGRSVKLMSIKIEPVTVPRLFLLGDSTVTDHAMPPGASWGQMLPRFFGPDIAVANYAESGETLKSFLAELRLDKALSQMRPGDWVMIQFGHNDEKSQWPQTYAPAYSTYRAYLMAYVAEVRRLGGLPVLVTSTERAKFDAAGHIVPSHGAYPDAVRTLARQEQLAVIDLNAMSTAFYEALGPERIATAFMPGDATHHSDYGAYELARAVVQAMKDQHFIVAGQLRPGIDAFDPAHPDRVEDISF